MKPTDISAPDYFHKVDGFGLGMLFRDHRAATPALSIRDHPYRNRKGIRRPSVNACLIAVSASSGPNAP
ncbi:MAG TPA: hypothetical protein VG758_27445 [Hyphomicrobiaceae bacterium]|jgi:hypothetical protein|nr:hypothetical protein [Hyphomicrobiaceae bacterium]